MKNGINKQLRIGTRVESEHKDTYKFLKGYVAKTGKLPPQKVFYKSIARSHIKEKPTYYKKLLAAKL